MVQFKLPLAAADATGGVVFCGIVVLEAALLQPLEVDVTTKLYVPPVVIPEGFCKEEVNPAGPVHA